LHQEGVTVKRYIINPRLAPMPDWSGDGPDAENYLSRTVHEPDPTPYPIGLLDAQGNELYAVNEMEPIGFVRFEVK
jgi:hypothetical protein